MQAEPTPAATIEVAALLAVLDVDGCDEAGVSIVRQRRSVSTPSATGPQARRADELQYELDQGPCLDAIWDAPVVDCPDITADPRWPVWGERVAAETGLHSLLAVRLFTHEDTVGALNLYSLSPDAFTARDREVAVALAAHVAVAVRGAQIDENLRRALSTRSVIAMSMGIVMERHDLSESQAFRALTQLASQEERRVVDIAEYIVRTRELPPGLQLDQDPS